MPEAPPEALRWKDQPATNESVIASARAVLEGLHAITRCFGIPEAVFPVRQDISAAIAKLDALVREKEGSK